MAALAAKKVESLADLLREFNHQNGVTVAYKAFYNRLARPAFAEFMRQMLTRLVEQLSIRILAPEGNAAVARFDDIVIQDGSSFALKKALSEVFSGRFTTVEPAADEVSAVEISTRRVAMCAGHIIDELVAALLAYTSIAAVFRDGITFLLANARRANPKRDRKKGRLRSGLVVVGTRPQVITYVRRLSPGVVRHC